MRRVGFYYHGARYYAPWLGRWTSCDPGGLIDGPCVYAYVRCKPITGTDSSGLGTSNPMTAEEFQDELSKHAQEVSNNPDDLIVGDRATGTPPDKITVDPIKGTEGDVAKTTPTKGKGELKTGPYNKGKAKVRGHHVVQSGAFKNKGGKDTLRSAALSVSQKEGALSQPKAVGKSSNSVAHVRAGQVQSAVDEGRLGKAKSLDLPADPAGKLPRVTVDASGDGTLTGGPSPWAEEVKGNLALQAGGAHPEDALNATLKASNERKAADMLPASIPGQKWQNVKEGVLSLVESAAKSKGVKATVAVGGVLLSGVAKAAPVVGIGFGAADLASEVKSGDARRATLAAVGMSEIPIVSQAADIGLAVEDAGWAAKEILDPGQQLEMWYYNTFLK